MLEHSEIKKVFDAMAKCRELSAKDRDLLLNFLQNSPEPNEVLKTAYDKVTAMYQLDDHGQTFYNVDPSMVKKK